MVVDISKFSEGDQDEVRKAEEDLRRVLKGSLIDQEGMKERKSPEKIIAEQQEEEKEKELKEFNISKIKNYESGYDLGKLEELKELISKRKERGEPVADLEEILRKMLAEMDREKALNASGKEENYISDENNNINRSSFDNDGEESGFDEIRRELMMLTRLLLKKGILKVCEIASNVAGGDDDCDFSQVYMIDNSVNISAEDSKRISRLREAESLFFGKKKENGLPVFTKKHKSEDGTTFTSHHFVLSKNYSGEKNILEMSDEDIARNREELENDPEQFIVCSVAYCKSEKERSEVENSAKDVYNTILETTQEKLKKVGFVAPTEEDSSQKVPDMREKPGGRGIGR